MIEPPVREATVSDLIATAFHLSIYDNGFAPGPRSSADDRRPQVPAEATDTARTPDRALTPDLAPCRRNRATAYLEVRHSVT